MTNHPHQEPVQVPLVELVNYTRFPFETFYSLWHGSRTDAATLTAEEVHVEYLRSLRNSLENTPYISDSKFYTGRADRPFHDEYDAIINQIAALDFPLKETVLFTFEFSNVTIAWREQMVRQRRGIYWSQTSRTRDLSTFSDNLWFYEPLSIAQNEATHDRYILTMNQIQEAYQFFVNNGIHREDARAVLPAYQTHRIAGTFSARTLEDTMEDRICFIAQVELWGPIIRQMKEQLVAIEPRLGLLFHPPCIKGGKYRFCPFEYENQRRVEGLDPMGPCPLWAMSEGLDWKTVPLQENAELQYEKQRVLWPDDIRTAVDRYIEGAALEVDPESGV